MFVARPSAKGQGARLTAQTATLLQVLWTDPLVRLWVLASLNTVAGIASSFAPDEARLDFYAATSQILPVLLLVLVVEVRAFNVTDIRPSDRRERRLVYLAAAYALSLLVIFAFAAIAGVALLGKPATRKP